MIYICMIEQKKIPPIFKDDKCCDQMTPSHIKTQEEQDLDYKRIFSGNITFKSSAIKTINRK